MYDMQTVFLLVGVLPFDISSNALNIDTSDIIIHHKLMINQVQDLIVNHAVLFFNAWCSLLKKKSPSYSLTKTSFDGQSKPKSKPSFKPWPCPSVVCTLG